MFLSAPPARLDSQQNRTGDLLRRLCSIIRRVPGRSCAAPLASLSHCSHACCPPSLCARVFAARARDFAQTTVALLQPLRNLPAMLLLAHDLSLDAWERVASFRSTGVFTGAVLAAAARGSGAVSSESGDPARLVRASVSFCAFSPSTALVIRLENAPASHNTSDSARLDYCIPTRMPSSLWSALVCVRVIQRSETSVARRARVEVGTFSRANSNKKSRETKQEERKGNGSRAEMVRSSSHMCHSAMCGRCC